MMERLTHQGEYGPYWDKSVFKKHGGMEEDLIIDRLAYYEDMEEQGRLHITPCKVGDWVYALWDVPTASKYVVYCAEVKEISHSVRNCRPTITYKLEPIEYRGRRKEYRGDDFGKTVFLTSEEAEQALKGGKANVC